MDSIDIVYSEYEPYGEFIALLVSKLYAKNSSKTPKIVINTCAIEHLLIQKYIHSHPSVLVPCTNHSFISTVVYVASVMGSITLNRGIVKAATNRLTILSSLKQADIKIPRFWATLNLSLLFPKIQLEDYPIVIKSLNLPAQKKTIVRNVEEFHAFICQHQNQVREAKTLYFIEELIAHDPNYKKIYVCGNKIAAYNKGPVSNPDPVRLQITTDLRVLVEKIGKILQLDFFSVDTIEIDNEDIVVDVNFYPVYNYHREAYNWLADLITNTLSED